jgi:hypothetical protein
VVGRQRVGVLEPVVDDPDKAAFEAFQGAVAAVALGDATLIVGLARAVDPNENQARGNILWPGLFRSGDRI